MAHGKTAGEARDDAVSAHHGGTGAVAEQRLELPAGRDRPHVAGGHQGFTHGSGRDGVEREAKRRGPGAKRPGDVGGQDRDRKIDDGGQERRVGLLDVRRRGRGEEAGADAARLASGHRVERRLGRHGERVLVVVGHGALAAGAPAPHLSERLA